MWVWEDGLKTYPFDGWRRPSLGSGSITTLPMDDRERVKAAGHERRKRETRFGFGRALENRR